MCALRARGRGRPGAGRDYASPIGETALNGSAARERPRWRARAWSAARSGLAAAGLVWALWVASFNDLEFGGSDALRPFSFLQRMFGEVDQAAGYQFGLAFLWAPFYALGKLLEAAGVRTAEGQPIGIAAITLGTSMLVAVACALLVPLLRSLRLPHPAFVLVAAVFGSPLFYYGSFTTGLSHVADTLLVTALVVLCFRYFRAERPSLWLPAAMGAIAGYAGTVRFFNGFTGVALVLGLLYYRRLAAAAAAAAAGGATFGLLSAVPFLVGVSSLTSGYARGGSSSVSVVYEFSPENPFLLLFSDRRGLFVWTPVTLLGVLGFLLLLRRRPDVRAFLVVTAGMGLALVLPFVLVRYWAGQAAFSARYLTPLFPLVVLGLAALVQWRPRVVVPAASLLALWSVALAFYGPPGLGFVDRASGFPRRVIEGEITPAEYVDRIYHRGRYRAFLPDPVDHG